MPEPVGWAGTRKVKPIWILPKQETVSGSDISWAVCKSAPHSRQITMPAPHYSFFFTGRMPFLPPNQQRQSTEGTEVLQHYLAKQKLVNCIFSVKFCICFANTKKRFYLITTKPVPLSKQMTIHTGVRTGPADARPII